MSLGMCECVCLQSVGRDSLYNKQYLTPEIYEFKLESVRNLMATILSKKQATSSW